jgi:hypothetical protein
VREIARYAPNDTTDYQPAIRTSIDFEAADGDADELTETLAAALDEPGWYVNFQSDDVAFVIFREKIWGET